MDEEELMEMAFRIADEASQSLIESTGLKDSAYTYVLTDKDFKDDAVVEAVDYLKARGLAHDHAFVGGIVVTFAEDL